MHWQNHQNQGQISFCKSVENLLTVSFECELNETHSMMYLFPIDFLFVWMNVLRSWMLSALKTVTFYSKCCTESIGNPQIYQVLFFSVSPSHCLYAIMTHNMRDGISANEVDQFWSAFIRRVFKLGVLSFLAIFFTLGIVIEPSPDPLRMIISHGKDFLW